MTITAFTSTRPRTDPALLAGGRPLMLSRILVSGLALGGLIVCVNGLSAEADRLNVLNEELALATGAGHSAVPAAVREAGSKHALDCRKDFRRAATAVALSDVPASSDASYVAQLSRATSEIKKQLGCSPADGNAWLLLAAVSELAGQHTLALPYVKTSQAYAPREGWIVVCRIEFACSTTEDSGGLLEANRRDFRTLLNGRAFAKAAVPRHSRR